jgi:hypothetical protein
VTGGLVVIAARVLRDDQQAAARSPILTGVSEKCFSNRRNRNEHT